MSKELSGKERIDRILRGDDIDRPAVSAWRHFYDKENNKEDLVKSMLDYQDEFDWDFIKINSRASYHVEDWGVKLKFSNDPLLKPIEESFPVKSKSDWASIRPLDWRSGVLGEVLSAGSEILKSVRSRVYCVPTIFSPLSIAADLVESDDKFVSLLNEAPRELHGALEAITETFRGYVAEYIKMGMAGIFFATTEWATRDRLTEDQYLEFGRPYDLRVLEAASGGFFNITHICKTNNMLPLFRDYPTPILSWNPFEPGNLSISQAAQISDKIFMTGIDQKSVLRDGTPEAIKDQIDRSLREVPPGKLIIAPGCAVKVDTPDDNMRFLSNTVKGWKP
ncbi:MAG: uroporphyrinogen decarboxylase family protein [candidate division Zixibacteria bacterium]